MTGKWVKFLAFLAVVAVFALSTPSVRRHVFGPRAGDSVLPQANGIDVARIEISGPETTATLSRTAGTWSVDELYGYPAKTAIITGLIAKIVGLERSAESVTSASATYDSVVKFFGPNGQVLSELALGPVIESRGGGRLVRAGNQAPVIVHEFFDEVSTLPEEWTDRQFLGIAPHLIQQISIVGFGADYTIERVGGEYRIAGRSPEMQFNQALARRMFEGFEQMKFVGVCDPAVPDDAVSLADHELIQITCLDGMVYTLHAGRVLADSSNRALRVAVSVRAEPEPNRVQAQIVADREFNELEGASNEAGDLDKYRAKRYEEMLAEYQATLRKRQADARALSSGFARWRFLVPASLLEQLMPNQAILQQ